MENYNGGQEVRQIRSKGLNNSPSVISLHEQQQIAARDHLIQKPRRSKDSRKSRPDDEYSDEISRIMQAPQGPVGLAKSNKKSSLSVIEQQQLIAQRINEGKRQKGMVSQSALEHHVESGKPTSLERKLSPSPSNAILRGEVRHHESSMPQLAHNSSLLQSSANSKKKILLNGGS